jgi:hypothetical protein
VYLTIEGTNATGEIEVLDDVQEPSWTDVEAHLRSIDGTRCTAITLHREGSYLEVARVDAGDAPNAYVLTGSCDRKAMVFYAPTEGLPLERIWVRDDQVSGQLAVSLETAIQAVQRFTNTGVLSTSTGWHPVDRLVDSRGNMKPITIELVAGTRTNGSTVTEEVRVAPLGEGRFRVLQSPGLVLGIAAGDAIELLDGLTIDVAAGFPALEARLNALVAQFPGCEWYYGNVHDPDDGVTPLNWWK